MHRKKIVILGTGGTIAGRSADASDHVAYVAAELGVATLVESIAGLASAHELLVEQVAQVDSKDMSFAIWASLAERVNHFSACDDVAGIVITHGTDTLEETAYFLHALLSPSKPVVLTCAMRPASALTPDGPQNLRDAITVAGTVGAMGVVAVCAGVVHCAADVQKCHTYRLDAFSSGDAGPIAYVEDNRLRFVRNWPAAQETRAYAAIENIATLKSAISWPKVEVVMNYAGAGGGLVHALVAAGVQGLVLAGTGNGTVHHELEAALKVAQFGGISVVRATRCADGHVLTLPGDIFESANDLSPVKARIALMLALMLPGFGQRASAPKALAVISSTVPMPLMAR